MTSTLMTKILPSPLGPLRLTFTEKGLQSLRLKEKESAEQEISSTHGTPIFVTEFETWLRDYFKGASPQMPKSQWIDWTRFSTTEKKIYSALLKTSPGSTMSYKDLATEAGVPNGSRVAGSAMAKNPLPILIPCHRVRPSQTTEIGAYSFCEGPATKARLLNLELSILHDEFQPHWEFDWKSATQHLAGNHDKFKELSRAANQLRTRGNKRGSTFESLIRAILSQQVHPKAAATLRERLWNTFGTTRDGVTKLNLKKMANLSEGDRLRASLSPQKSRAVQELAQMGLDGKIPEYSELLFLSDEEVIKRLTAFRGIGPWTAQMLLIFSLGRANIWPVDDLGVQLGAKKLLNLRTRLDKKKLERIGRSWAPYRTAASLFLWHVHSTPEVTASQPGKHRGKK